MTKSKLLRIDIPMAALPSWRTLNAKLARLDDDVPCTGAGAADWTSEDRTRRTRAAAECAGCAAILECRAYGHGIQRNLERTGRNRSPAATRPHTEGEQR